MKRILIVISIIGALVFIGGQFQKNVAISANAGTSVIASGEVVGIKLYADGLLAVQLAQFTDINQKMVSPALDAGIKIGDVLVKINGKKIQSTVQFSAEMLKNKSKPISIIYYSQNQLKTAIIIPKMDAKDNKYKIGLWVRDSAAGIGTVTFINPQTGDFVGLGHGIVDVDIGSVYRVSNGEITRAKIININKGKAGQPGEIQGIIDQEIPPIGTIGGNTKHGIYGKMSDFDKNGQSFEIMDKNLVKVGECYIISNLSGEKKEYRCEIVKFSLLRDNFLIRVTDPELIELTGGIVQGMSGSPIIQNNKLIGALTHVLVSDSTQGYGIFATDMLKLNK